VLLWRAPARVVTSRMIRDDFPARSLFPHITCEGLRVDVDCRMSASADEREKESLRKLLHRERGCTA